MYFSFIVRAINFNSYINSLIEIISYNSHNFRRTTILNFYFLKNSVNITTVILPRHCNNHHRFYPLQYLRLNRQTMNSGHPVYACISLLLGLQRHSRKADRPSLFAAFFARKDFVQLKAKFRPLMSKYARFLERKGVRVFGRFAVEAAANFSKSPLACDATRKKRANSFIQLFARASASV